MVLMLVGNPGVPLAASSAVVVEPYPGGTLKARMHFERDRPEGQSTTYDENGRVQFIYHYRKGRVTVREDYRPDGKLLRKQEFPQPPGQP